MNSNFDGSWEADGYDGCVNMLLATAVVSSDSHRAVGLELLLGVE